MEAPKWRIVGGEDKGGVLVREGEDLASPQLEARLATDSILEETELLGDRLYYKLVEGVGPETGWISIRVKGKDLAVRYGQAPQESSDDAYVSEDMKSAEEEEVKPEVGAEYQGSQKTDGTARRGEGPQGAACEKDKSESQEEPSARLGRFLLGCEMSDLRTDLRVIPGEVPMREWCLESVAVADTVLGRDKSMRLVQYSMRMLTGLVPAWTQGRPGNLMRTLAVARKALRFWRPLRSWRSIDEVLRAKAGSDLARTEFDRKLTLVELASFAIYCLIDHLAFYQRVGGLKTWTANQADALDRVAEFFWTVESVPVVWREMRELGRIRKEQELSNVSNDALRERRRKALMALFKAGVCDIPCAFYFWLMNAETRNKGKHKAWCGFLGVLASLVSLHGMWPRGRMKGM